MVISQAINEYNIQSQTMPAYCVFVMEKATQTNLQIWILVLEFGVTDELMLNSTVGGKKVERNTLYKQQISVNCEGGYLYQISPLWW